MIRALLLAILRLYQRAISPWIGPVCRFEPSCSRYAAACIETHGALRGTLLSLVRLCKCHPLHPGGLDVPPPAGARFSVFGSVLREEPRATGGVEFDRMPRANTRDARAESSPPPPPGFRLVPRHSAEI